MVYSFSSSSSSSSSSCTFLPRTLHLLLLALVLIVSRVRGEGACECTVFLSEDGWGQEITQVVPPFPVTSCFSYIECRKECLQKFAAWRGDVNQQLPVQGVTVGQLLCRHLASRGLPHLPPSEIHLYMSMCEGPWQYTEAKLLEPLCCSAGVHMSCRSGGAGYRSRRLSSSPALALPRHNDAPVPVSLPTSSHSAPRSLNM